MKTTVSLCQVALLVFLILPAYADTKTIISEATYSMGDGETPAFAETMALQKAKQTALEEAGTYVQSYTKVLNQQLTADEIQTITGGVLQVRILDKKREMIGDGMRHYVKIEATVTTEKISDLAKRIKGKNVVEDYKKLQEEYSRLSKEIQTWKQLIAKTPTGPEREAALNQIREREKGFALAQRNEAAFYLRLVSGEALHSKALASQSKKQSEKAAIDALFRKILEQGHVITIGEPEITSTLKDSSQADISVLVTLRLSEVVGSEMEETAHSLGGEVQTIDTHFNEGREGRAIRISKDIELLEYFQKRISNLVFALEFAREDKRRMGCYLSTLIPDYPVKGDRFLLGSVLPGEMHGILLATGVSSFSATPDERQGFVAVLRSSTTFTAKTRIPLKAAQTIKTVLGRFIEDTEPNLQTVQGMHQCQLIGASRKAPAQSAETKEQKKQPSLSELAKQLEQVQRPRSTEAADNRLRDTLRGIERPPEAPRLGEYRSASVPAPRIGIAVKPVTTIQVAGDVAGLAQYLTIVQNKINEQWVAPPVDMTSRAYQVVIKFKLHRSGRISDVVVEQESGNGYYDDAGKRAVLSAGSLPPVPPYVTEETLETNFSFTVGELGNGVPTSKDGAPMELALEASELSWVVVQTDDATPHESLLRPGDRLIWKAQEKFSLTIGNAGGIRGELNGKPLAPFGPKGKVVRDIVLTR